MKRLKQSQLIHIWEEYEFYLSIPKSFKGTNKPFIFFYYYNAKTNKSERIRRYIGKNGGDLKKVKEEAKSLVQDLILLLKGNWNPITNTYNELGIKPTSTVLESVQYWISKREEACKNKAIGPRALKNNKILMAHFRSYLTEHNILYLRPSSITNVHVKEFLDKKTSERGWGKVTYNTYLVDLGTFFNYLKDVKIVSENPCDKVSKKNTRTDSSRFKVFEKIELEKVAKLLASDSKFLGLHLASKLLFKYNIRPLEMTRIQLVDIDLEKELLTLPSHKTKNGNEARFQLDSEIMNLLQPLLEGSPRNHYLFGGRNITGDKQLSEDYFGQNWRYFREKYKLPAHLKFYALKHTSNYYDIEGGASYEEIRQRNRHANLQITTLYVKERLFKNVIKPSKQNLF